MGQATVGATSTVPIFTVPSGLCNVTFWNVSVPNIYVGTSTAVTSSNGLVCHSIPTSFFNYVSSKGSTFYGANTSATSGVVNFVIVTDQG
jgi:hypothetical protein